MQKKNISLFKRFFTYIFIMTSFIFFTLNMSTTAYIVKETYGRSNKIINDYLINTGFYPVKEIMLAAGYTSQELHTFKTASAGKPIVIKFDFKNSLCKKNQYSFSLKDQYQKLNGKYYIRKELLGSILNGNVEYINDEFRFIPVVLRPHEWCKISSLIAHAGGAVRGKNCNDYYTNSLEAITQNYNLGHRVFEIDFYLTRDNKLAAVHDWEQFGERNGVFLSSKQWKNSRTYGKPITQNRFTTMMIEDILDEMLVNKDMFIVTDTKSTEFTDDKVRLQFKLIYDAAFQRDPNLLNRIIPQIYNEKTYDIVTSIYSFPSIIYTTYATRASADKILQFAKAKKEIKVITMNHRDIRLTQDTIKEIHNMGKLVYTHSHVAYPEIASIKARGVDGFYTEFILPSDIEIYNKCSVKTY